MCDSVPKLTSFQTVCVVYVIPLHRRPQMQGMMGALMGVASIAGPLIVRRWLHVQCDVALVLLFEFAHRGRRDGRHLSLSRHT